MNAAAGGTVVPYDRRRDRRVPVDFAIEMWASGRTVRGRATNVSLGGAYVELDEAMEGAGDRAWLRSAALGESVQVELCHRVEASGPPFGTGVRFFDAIRVRRRIRDLIGCP